MKAARGLHGSNRYLLAPGSAAWEWIATLGAAGAVTLVYFLAARLGLALLSAPSDVAVFWPASGIAAGILIVAGRRAYPEVVIGVVVGTVAANLMSDRSLLTSLFKGFCNSGEAVLAAWLLERWFGWPFQFGELRRVGGFLAAAGLATAGSAIGGAAAMVLLNTNTTAPFWNVWRAWFLSDGVGIVVVAPVLIGLAQVRRERPSRGEWIEGTGVLALLASASLYVATHPAGSWITFSPGAVVVPLLLWLTARCPSAFAIVGAFVASITVILATTIGVGRFGDAAVPMMERVKGAQAAVITVTLYTLAMVALFAQRKAAEAGLQKSEGRLAKERAMLARLHEISARLWRKRDLRQALDEILTGAIELLGADMGTIRILNTQSGVLKVEAHRGFKQKALDLVDGVPAAGGSLCARALRAGERMEIEDVETDELFGPFRPLARAAGYRAMQSTPIMSREGMPLGMLATHFRSAHKPSEQDLRLLDLYVRQAADIIEHHKADDALHESEERLRLAGKAGLVGTFAYDTDTEIMQISEGYVAIHGFPDGTAEIARSKCLASVHSGDIEHVQQRRDEAFCKGSREYSVEYRIIRPGGEVRWVETRCCISYHEGRPRRVIGVSIDVTERKRAELALAERNAQLALAGRAALVGPFAYDVETERVQISEGYAAIFGFPEGTTEIMRSQWRARAHPEDIQRVEDLRSQAFRQRKGEYSVEYRTCLPDRGSRWIEGRSFVSYDGDGHPRRMVGVNIDVTERKCAEERQNVLVAELDHRVKNVLASVSAVVSHTQRESTSVANFVEALDGRIRSMATTHELLSAGRWQGVSLANLVQRELAPYATRDNIEINGPEVVLRPEAGQAMAMVLHELATNAAKYGALSTTNGHVSIRWDRRPNGQGRSQLVLEWQEIGGPPVVATSNPNYGTSIIRDLIPYEFGGTVDLVLAPDGVRCHLQLQGDWLSNDGHYAR